MSKKDAAIYRKAAERMCNSFAGCCYQISQITRDEDYYSEMQERFADIFCPSKNLRNGYWWDEGFDEESWRGPRILALCFAAAMADAGDL